MAITRVAVNANVLNWALKRSGKSVSGLEKKFPQLVQWLTGEKQPTLHQLENLAKQTRTPFGYLFLEHPPMEKLPIPYFRTFEKGPPSQVSPELLDTIYEMQKRQIWMREYLIQQGHNALPFVQSMKISEPVQSIAQCMREILHVGKDWASDLKTWSDGLQFLRESIEKAGCRDFLSGMI